MANISCYDTVMNPEYHAIRSWLATSRERCKVWERTGDMCVPRIFQFPLEAANKDFERLETRHGMKGHTLSTISHVPKVKSGSRTWRSVFLDVWRRAPTVLTLVKDTEDPFLDLTGNFLSLEHMAARRASGSTWSCGRVMRLSKTLGGKRAMRRWDALILLCLERTNQPSKR